MAWHPLPARKGESYIISPFSNLRQYFFLVQMILFQREQILKVVLDRLQ